MKQWGHWMLWGMGLALPLIGRGDGAAYTVKSDVAFLGSERKEKLDLYLPSGPSPSGLGATRSTSLGRAAVVYFHGGGWVRGDKATDREKEIGGTLASMTLLSIY